MRQGKRRFVLAIVECIQTDTAHSQIFALYIDGPFNFNFTRHFQSSNQKFPQDNYFSLQTERHKRKTNIKVVCFVLVCLLFWAVDGDAKAATFKLCLRKQKPISLYAHTAHRKSQQQALVVFFMGTRLVPTRANLLDRLQSKIRQFRSNCTRVDMEWARIIPRFRWSLKRFKRMCIEILFFIENQMIQDAKYQSNLM